MLLYNLEIERRKNQRRAERYLQRLLGSHRSESAVFPPKCQNGCTFAWTANTQSHLNKNVWSSTQNLSPAVDVEVDDRRFWELEAFENSLLVFPPFQQLFFWCFVQYHLMLFAFLFGSLKNDLSDVGVSRGTFTWKTDSFMKIDSNQIKWSFGFHLDVSRMVRSSSSSSSSPPSSPFFPSLVGLQVIWLHTMCPNIFNGSPDHCLCFDPWVHGSNALHHSLSKHVSPSYASYLLC